MIVRHRETLDDIQEAADLPLPSGWTWVTVGDMLIEAQYGTSAKTTAESRGVPVLRMGNIQDGTLVLDSLKFLPRDHREFPTLLLRDGDVLFNRTNSSELVGKTAVYRGNPALCSFASYLIRLRLQPAFVPEYLAWYVNSPFGRQWVASVVSQQVGQANVNGTKLKNLRVPVPCYDEQRRIVAEIDKQFTRLVGGVIVLDRQRKRFQRLRDSILNVASTTRLSGGDYATIAEVSAAIVDCPHSTPTFVKNGLPCIDTTCMKQGKVVFERVRFVSADTYVSRISRLKPSHGDIVFAREGTVGTAVVLPERFEPCLGQRVMLIRPSARLDGRFLAHVLNSDFVRTQYHSRIIGTTAPHLNVRDVKELRVPVPPIREQERLAATIDRQLSACDALEESVAKNLRRAHTLRQSILHRAFSGQL